MISKRIFGLWKVGWKVHIVKIPEYSNFHGLVEGLYCRIAIFAYLV